MNSSRRDFLGLIGVLAGTHLGRFASWGQTRCFVLNDTCIAGFQFHDGSKMLWDLHEGDSLRLVAEPRNKHDKWAVRIESHGRHIGYLPRKQNEPVSRLLQQQYNVRCRITQVDREAAPWRAVRVQVSIQV